MRRAALVLIAMLAIAGCSSTVLLGTLSADGGGGGPDLARPRFDGFDGGDFGHGDGFDGGGVLDLGCDGGALVDLAQ